MTSDTYSNTLGFLAMVTGNDNNTWGSNCNTAVFQIFEDAIANTLTSSVTGGTLDLSGSPPPNAASQVRYAALIFSGTLASNQIVKVPNLTKWWWVQNTTSGAFTLTIETPSATALGVIPQNSGWQLVYCDGGTNIIVSPFNSKQIQMPDGSAAAPAYSNFTEPKSGWYRYGTQDWRLSINGVDVIQATGTSASSASVVNIFSPNSLQVAGGNVLATNQVVAAADGTVSAPGISFASELGTGFYRIGAGDVGLSLLGTKTAEITATNFTLASTNVTFSGSGAFTFAGTGTFKWAGATGAGADLSPSSFSTEQDNYNPTNLSTASCLRLNPTSACVVTGIAGGAAGRELELLNIGTATLQFPASNSSSTASNQFANTFNLVPSQSITLRYDATSSLWRPKNVATAYSSCAIAAVSPDLLITTNGTTGVTITAGEAVLVDARGNGIKFENVSVSIATTSTGPVAAILARGRPAPAISIGWFRTASPSMPWRRHRVPPRRSCRISPAITSTPSASAAVLRTAVLTSITRRKKAVPRR